MTDGLCLRRQTISVYVVRQAGPSSQDGSTCGHQKLRIDFPWGPFPFPFSLDANVSSSDSESSPSSLSLFRSLFPRRYSIGNVRKVVHGDRRIHLAQSTTLTPADSALPRSGCAILTGLVLVIITPLEHSRSVVASIQEYENREKL